jgi:hypothetical protein
MDCVRVLDADGKIIPESIINVSCGIRVRAMSQPNVDLAAQRHAVTTNGYIQDSNKYRRVQNRT